MAYKLKPRGYQKISAATLAAATALTVPTAANRALIVAAAAGVAWRDDGTDPTATDGVPISSGGSMLYDGDLSAIKFILISGSPILHVAYYEE